jgi:recombinational DNA repair ATPase RecF
MGALLTQIWSWAASELRYWERAALEKVATHARLEEKDYQELVEYFLRDAGLCAEQGGRPQLSFPADPPTYAALAPCRLERLFNLKNVNALPAAQEIRFGPQLTIVYGNNGVGKTGYTRPLASACFARGERQVLPNLTSANSKSLPQADIEISVGGHKQLIRWTDGNRLREMNKFYVFDGNSLLAHLNRPNSLSFAPRGLNILTRLADLTDQVRERVRILIETRDSSPRFHESFDWDSAIKSLLVDLKADTDIRILEKHSTLTEADIARIEQLEKELAQLRLLDPLKEIETKRQEKRDLQNLVDSLSSMETALGETSEHEVQVLIDDVLARRKEVEQSGAQQFQSNHFSQVGTDLWREFLTVARRLSEAEGKSKDEYPKPGNYCLFCDQALSQDSIDLIRRFWKFLESDAKVRLENSIEASGQRMRALHSLKLDLLAADSKVRAILQAEIPHIVPAIDSQIEAFEARRQEFLESLDTFQFQPVAPLIQAEKTDIKWIIQIRQKDIEEITQSNAAQRSASVRRELVELQHRQKLAQKLPEIKTFLEDKKWAAKAKQSLGSTRNITTKYNELYKELITDKYIELFEATLKRFNHEIEITLDTKGSKGETVRQLVLSPSKFMVARPVEQVLSDGEKRAVSISDFLTEVSLDDSSWGVILDDPVTSLDDSWKDTMAQCLVEQTAKRQVIIFTHDLAFVYFLKAHAEKLSVEVASSYVTRETSGPGFVYPNEGPVCERDYKSANIARQHYSKANGASPSEQQLALQHGFGALRTSYEAFIIFDLFQDVVQRFGERLSFGRLKNVRVSQELIDEIIERMEVLSRYIEAHLHSDRFVSVKPTPQDLFNEIERFESIKKRQQLLIKGADRAS